MGGSEEELMQLIREDIARLRAEMNQRFDRMANGHMVPSVVTGAVPTFTPAQQAILKLVCKGESNKHIARTLNLPETTVKARVRDVMHKLVVTNRTQIAIVAAKMRLT